MKLYSLLFLSLLFLISCQKAVSDLPSPIDPSFSSLPSSISWLSAEYPEDNIILRFKYNNSPARTIEVYLDDSATTNLFDYLALRYYYTSDGYFTKRESFDEVGNVYTRTTAERYDNNLPKRVVFEENGLSDKDTFNFSFADSIGNSSYKIMTVQYIFDDFGDTMSMISKLTFQNKNVLKEETNSLNNTPERIIDIADYTYKYNAVGQRISSSSTYSGIDYEDIFSYEANKNGLNSLFDALSGVDGHYLTNYSEFLFDSDHDFLFYPLYIILRYQNSINSYEGEIAIEAHRFGLLKDIQIKETSSSSSVNNAVTFKNIFDSTNRITESKVLSENYLEGSWKISY